MTLQSFVFIPGKVKGKVPAIAVFNIKNISYSNYIYLSREIINNNNCRGSKPERTNLLGAIIEEIN